MLTDTTAGNTTRPPGGATGAIPSAGPPLHPNTRPSGAALRRRWRSQGRGPGASL